MVQARPNSSLDINHTALANGYASCAFCQTLSLLGDEKQSYARCRTCGAKVLHRKSNSLSHTWALVIFGFILFIPAHIFQ